MVGVQTRLCTPTESKELKMKRNKSVVLILILAFCITSCATVGQLPEITDSNERFIATSYKVLRSAGIVYDNLMKSSNDLYTRGLISEREKLDIIKFGMDFYEIYRRASDLLLVFAETKDDPTKEKILSLLQEVNKMLADKISERNER